MKVFSVCRRSMQKLSVRAPAADTNPSLITQRLFNNHLSNSSKVRKPPIYDQLKSEERKQFDRTRIRIESQRNNTCTLALDFSKATLASKFNNEIALLTLCENYIVEHANRRVDMFFYTLIAYYQTMLTPVEGHTNFQYGIGQPIGTSGTQACHSSFTPSLVDETIFYNEGEQIKYKSLISRTHFAQSLNATVELPSIVNAFDDILESICRPKCLDILREVSCAHIDPIRGLCDFLSMMNTILEDFKRQALSKNYTALTYPNLNMHRYIHPKLINFVIKGTVEASYDPQSNTVNDQYLQMQLRLTPEEKRRWEQNIKIRKRIYFDKIMEIQNEILSAESQETVCAV